MEKSFDHNGKYQRINLNMPKNLPPRLDKRDYIGDSPITEVGKFQARLTGEALLDIQGAKFNYCYVSPSLRCIQTAHQILKSQGLEREIKIRIEPSVFECTNLYKSIPKFFSNDILLKYGFNIDMFYKPLLSAEKLKLKESYKYYYNRSYNFSKFIVSQHEREGGNILVIGHAGSLEACTRQITGSQIRSLQEFNAVVGKTPFLGICLLEKENNLFKIKHSGIPPLAHHSNVNFDASTVLPI